MPFHHRLERKIFTRLGAGFLVLIPLVITIIVFRLLYIWVEDFMSPLVDTALGRSLPGVGFAAFFVLLYLVGLVATSVMGRRVIDLGHNVFGNIPVVRLLYGAAKEAIDIITAASSREFRRVVFVEYPRKGVKAIGFVTGQFTDEDGKQQVAVYIPTTPNPTSGYLAILPPEETIPTNMRVDEAMKMIVSGGILVPPSLEESMTEGDGVNR